MLTILENQTPNADSYSSTTKPTIIKCSDGLSIGSAGGKEDPVKPEEENRDPQDHRPGPGTIATMVNTQTTVSPYVKHSRGVL